MKTYSNGSRQLIVNADDFGRSKSINAAVIRAHSEGILTSASLMVTGEAFAEAVELARGHPGLGIGLHLVLVCGSSMLAPMDIPGLVDDQRAFSNHPLATGFRYFFRVGLRRQLCREMRAQFDKFRQTGLPLDHVNGHLHMHMHPTVFGLLKHRMHTWEIRRFRLVRDPFWLNTQLAPGRWIYRTSHAIVHWLLAALIEPQLRRRGIASTRAVFGLLQDGRVDEQYICRLLPRLPAGVSELYSHPSLDEFKHELDALISPKVMESVRQHGVKLIRYQDL
jgi:hopanoid biosynthesis associated protein HpnK